MVEILSGPTYFESLVALSNSQKETLSKLDNGETKYLPVVVSGLGRKLSFGLIQNPNKPDEILTMKGPLQLGNILELKAEENIYLEPLRIDPKSKPITSFIIKMSIRALNRQLEGTNFVP